MDHDLPFFSVVIPTYQRPERIAGCLQALTCLDYPRERFEVLVVDDGSDMPPEKIVHSFRDRLNAVFLSQAHAGPAQARNTGALFAKGTFLAFTDDDCIPAQNWLRALAARFIATPKSAIGGRTLNARPENSFSTASQMLTDYLYGYFNIDPNRAFFFASNNLAMPAEQFRTLGGFNTTFPLAAGEDRELCGRWLRHGWRMVYAPEALVYHGQTLTFRSFWRQHFNYGRGAFRFHQMRAQQRNQNHIALEDRSFYLGILRYPFSQVQGGRAFLLAILLAASQGATATGLLWEKVQTTRYN